jgi:hypothetical protein
MRRYEVHIEATLAVSLVAEDEEAAKRAAYELAERIRLVVAGGRHGARVQLDAIGEADAWSEDEPGGEDER